MKATEYIKQALMDILKNMEFDYPEKANVEPPKDKKFGDLACNVAMLLAKPAKRNPREIATEIQAALVELDAIEKVDIAGPGFLNITLSPAFWQQTIPAVLDAGDDFGRSEMGKGRKVQVEYVSANPTGPLHIGHGRGAALGDSLARVLRFSGHEVETEYYVNDAGRQMELLGASIFARYSDQCDKPVQFPDDGYKGEYIGDLAAEVKEQHGDSLLSMDEAEAVGICKNYGKDTILAGIRKDLQGFNVEHQVWFSEKSLVDDNEIEKTFALLKDKGLAYDQDGAFWFKTTEFGDDKDRVLRKSSGDLTYFASDIAYHDNKYRRGFDLVVDIWGADHHGYIPRMKAAVQALGRDKDDLQVLLVQLVNLLAGGEQIAMSTRAGKFETLADVVADVGADSARFIFLSRKSDSKLDFDLELVKQKSMDNPVYYVQYAHARINSVFRKAAEAGVEVPEKATVEGLALLDTAEDLDLLKCVERFPEIVEASATTLSPHHLSFYLRELAGLLHRYYTVHHILGTGNTDLIAARLTLFKAVAQVLRNGLDLLGVSAPVSM